MYFYSTLLASLDSQVYLKRIQRLDFRQSPRHNANYRKELSFFLVFIIFVLLLPTLFRTMPLKVTASIVSVVVNMLIVFRSYQASSV